MKKKHSLQPYLHFNMDVSCGHQNSVFKWIRIITWNIALYLFPLFFTPPPLSSLLPALSSSCQYPFLTHRVLTLANKFGGRLSRRDSSGTIEPALCELTQAPGQQVAMEGKRGKAL